MLKCDFQMFFFLLVGVTFLFKSVHNTDCTKLLLVNEPNEIHLENTRYAIFCGNEIFFNGSISRIILVTSPKFQISNTTAANVTIEEYKRIEDEPTFSETWTITSNVPFNRSYFSDSTNIKVKFQTTEKWSDCNITLYYEEFKFETIKRKSSEVNKKEIAPWGDFDKDWDYRPNTNYIFNIDRNETLSSSDIYMTLNYLDIDKEKGEYLLIGAGSDLEVGPPRLCLTETSEEKRKYRVIDNTAFIVFVTNATRKGHKGFNISWDYNGEVIETREIDNKEDLRRSAPICIYNVSEAEQEINTKARDHFMDFREKFARVATDYARNYTMEKSDFIYSINATSVTIFRISARRYKDNESNEALYAMIKITTDPSKGERTFDQQDLENIIIKYGEEEDDIFKFRKCRPHYVPESWFYFGLIVIIPVICFALILWIWKQNPIAEHYEKKRMLKRVSKLDHSNFYVGKCDSAALATDENPYTTLPKLLLTNDQGRRTTLNLSDILQRDDNASDDELFNKMHTNKRPSDVIELQRLQRADLFFSSSTGQDNEAFEIDEDNNCTTEQRPQEDRAEHTYESVRSSASLLENTRL